MLLFLNRNCYFPNILDLFCRTSSIFRYSTRSSITTSKNFYSKHSRIELQKKCFLTCWHKCLEWNTRKNKKNCQKKFQSGDDKFITWHTDNWRWLHWNWKNYIKSKEKLHIYDLYFAIFFLYSSCYVISYLFTLCTLPSFDSLVCYICAFEFIVRLASTSYPYQTICILKLILKCLKCIFSIWILFSCILILFDKKI